MSYGYTVEIRSDVFGSDGIPHTFLTVTDSNGSQTNYGFAPEQTGLTGNGNVGIEPLSGDIPGHEYDASSGLIPITQEQYNALMDYIHRTDSNPPYYNLPRGAQCTAWALEGLSEADIIPSFLSPDMEMSNIFLDVIETLMFNPYTQALGFKTNEIINGYFNSSPSSGLFEYDTDRDGIPDHMDPDMDGDGIPNDQDSDTDGDGLPDGVDPNPLTPDSGRSNGFPPGYDPASGKGYSPLVLDLDGNGIHTTAITVSRTFYDLDNDGLSRKYSIKAA